MGRHVGEIELSDALLLKFLDFYDEGGKILTVQKDNYCTIKLQIEHPDMPEVFEGDSVKTVTPVYWLDQDTLGNRVTRRDRECPL